MKILIRTVRSIMAAVAIMALVVPSSTFAAIEYLDYNGAAAGFWDGVSVINTGMATVNTNWTTSAAGTAATVAFPVGNFIQVGVAPSDFNGATINLVIDPTGTLGSNPGGINIVSTNATVSWIGVSTNNAHYSHAFNWGVAAGSTLIVNGVSFNYNAELLTMTNGGTINFSNVLGNNTSTSTGGGVVENMPGGKVLLNQTSIGTFGNGASGPGTGFTLTNGILDFCTPQSFADVFGAFAAIQTVKLNGGWLDNLSGAPGTININLGSYSIGGNFGYLGSSQSMSLGSAGVTLATPSQITVSNNTLTIGGVITDNGSGFGITKAGLGTLALTGANTYTGPTTAAAGVLAVTTAATGAGAYTNSDGATLDVKVAAVGQSLSMSSLTLGTSTGGTLQFDVGALGNPTVAPINLNGGALTVNGANQISFASISAITNYPVVIPLITYGTASGNLSGLTLGAFPASVPPYKGYISNDIVNDVMDLVLTNGFVSLPPAPPIAVTWQGAASANWDLMTFNWISSGIVTNYSNLTTTGFGDPVVFDDTLVSHTNVVLTGALSPTTVTMDNVAFSYLFSGSGKLTGPTMLVVSNTGSLTLDNTGNNDFSGGVFINSGTLQIGNNDANGNPGTAGITNNGNLVFNRSDTLLGVATALPQISGTGAVIDNSSGTVTLNGVELYTGATVVNSGILAINGPNSNPSTLSSSSSLTINSGGTVQVQGDNSLGTAAPGLPVTINTGGVLTGLGSANGGVGTSSHLAANLTLNGGTLAMAGLQNNTSHGSWDLDGGVTVPGGSTTAIISALTVIPSQTGGTIFNVTNGTTPNGIDLNVSGTLINGGSTHDTGIVKNGPGTMALDNNNTYSVGTTLNGGVLQLGAAGDGAPLVSPLGTGPVTINSGSILKFTSSKGLTLTNTINDDGSGNTLVWSANGTNILTGVNGYSGPTLVTAGILALKNSGTIDSSASIVVSNATFDVSTGGTISSGGSLALTNSTFNLGTNLITSIAMLGMSNTTVIFPVTQGSASIQVTGNLATGGTTNIIQLTSIPGQAVYPADMPLIKYGSFANVTGGNVLTTLGVSLPALGSPVGYLTNNVLNNSIDLILLSDTLPPLNPITWNGQSSGVNAGNWDILITPDWVLSADGTTPYLFQNASVVTFDDTAHGATNVNVTTAVSPASITISNAVKTYIFSGTGSISGGAGLLKTNSGTAIFAETGGDSFSGGINVGSGLLVLSNANANIAGGVAVNGGELLDQHSGTISGGVTLNAGLAILDQPGTFTGNTVISFGSVLQLGNNDGKGSLPTGTLDNEGGLTLARSDIALNVTTTISGSGSLTNNGTGMVTLSPATSETYTGPTVVNAGVLVMAGQNVAVSGLYSSSQLIINNGGTVEVATDNALAGRGTPGILPITINAGGLLTGATNTDGGIGTSTHLQGTVTFNGGTLANSGTQAQTANGSWDLDDGVATSGGPTTSTITALNVVPTQAGVTTFDVLAGTTPSGIDLLITGTLINGTSIHDTGISKTDTGTLALDNNNTYLLGTAIYGGTVQLGTASDTNAWRSPLGYGPVTLYNAGSTLNFAGRMGVTVTNVINDDGSGSALVLVSSGTNILLAANNYTAPTVISNGVLIINGSLAAASSVTVVNGTLGGSGTVGGMVTNSGTIMAGTATNIGTLTCSSDVLNNSTATSLMKINASVSPSNDVLNVTGKLTYGGTLKVAVTGGTFVVGESFQLFIAGTYAGSFSATNLQSPGPGLGWSWNPANGTVTVIQTVNVTPAPITATVSGNILNLSWPADHTGWRLLAQTNSLAAGLNPSTNAWTTVSGSASVNSESITMDPNQGTVFYRLVYP